MLKDEKGEPGAVQFRSQSGLGYPGVGPEAP